MGRDKHNNVIYKPIGSGEKHKTVNVMKKVMSCYKARKHDRTVRQSWQKQRNDKGERERDRHNNMINRPNGGGEKTQDNKCNEKHVISYSKATKAHKKSHCINRIPDKR